MNTILSKADSCPGQEELVHRYLDDDLNLQEKEAFEGHLQQCTTCQALLADLQTLFVDLSALDEVTPIDVTAQVMTNLPAPTPQPRYGLIGQLALAGQVVIGLILILFAWPVIASTLNSQIVWQSWLALSDITFSLNGLVQDLAINLRNLLLTPPKLELSDFNIPFGPALALAACLGLAWLVGNGYLLRSSPPSLNDGEGL